MKKHTQMAVWQSDSTVFQEFSCQLVSEKNKKKA